MLDDRIEAAFSTYPKDCYQPEDHRREKRTVDEEDRVWRKRGPRTGRKWTIPARRMLIKKRTLMAGLTEEEDKTEEDHSGNQQFKEESCSWRIIVSFTED